MITGPSAGKATALLALHSGPGFVLPNACDAGSARILEQIGFPAIATTSVGRRKERLFRIDEAADRIAAARAEAPSGTFVLNARTDTYFAGEGDVFAETVQRAVRYLEAGADCVFVPARSGAKRPGTNTRPSWTGLSATDSSFSAALSVAAGRRSTPSRPPAQDEIRARLAQDLWAAAGLLQVGSIEPWALWLGSRTVQPAR